MENIKREKTQITNIRNETGVITKEPTEYYCLETKTKDSTKNRKLHINISYLYLNKVLENKIQQCKKRVIYHNQVDSIPGMFNIQRSINILNQYQYSEEEKTIWPYELTNIHHYDPEVVLLGIYPREIKTYSQKKPFTQRFTAVLFVIAHN